MPFTTWRCPEALSDMVTVRQIRLAFYKTRGIENLGPKAQKTELSGGEGMEAHLTLPRQGPLASRITHLSFLAPI